MFTIGKYNPMEKFNFPSGFLPLFLIILPTGCKQVKSNVVFFSMLNLIYNMAVFVGRNTFLLHFRNHCTDLKETWQKVIPWCSLPASCEVWYAKLKFKHRLQRKNRKYIYQFFEVHISCYTPLHNINFPMGLIFPVGYISLGIWPIPIEQFSFPKDFYFSIEILISHGILKTPMGFWNFLWEINNPMGILNFPWNLKYKNPVGKLKIPWEITSVFLIISSATFDQVKSNAEPDIQHCGNGFPLRWT